MDTSQSTKPIAALLARRLGPLAVVIAMLIAFIAPTIYYVEETRALRRKAGQHARYLAEQFRAVIAENPRLWKYQAQKYLEILHGFIPNKDIVAIRVMDETGKAITQYEYHEDRKTGFFGGDSTQHGTARLWFNNAVIGAIEVNVTGHRVLVNCLIFFVPSMILGIGIAMLAYFFPVRVVMKLEKDNQNLLRALKRSHHRLEARVRQRTADLAETNEALKQQIMARKRSQAALAEARDHLEERVALRTADLSDANRKLRFEIQNRAKAEEALRASKERLRHLSAKLLVVQEEERKRIALEIHDSLATTLSAIKFSLEKIRLDMQNGVARPDSLTSQIATIKLAIDESRRIMSGLHPSSLDELGVISTLEWFCSDFEKRYAHLEVRTKIGLAEYEIPENIKVVIFRLTQEAFHNVACHGNASRVQLSLTGAVDGIEFSVVDDGRGFDQRKIRLTPGPMSGMGLLSMRERTKNSGGIFSITSAKGQGTAIHVHWPSVRIRIAPEHAA